MTASGDGCVRVLEGGPGITELVMNRPERFNALQSRLVSDLHQAFAAFVKVGLSGCDVGVSWLLPRIIGASRAFEMLLTGRFMAAAEAIHAGLVSAVVAPDELRQSRPSWTSASPTSPAGDRPPARGDEANAV